MTQLALENTTDGPRDPLAMALLYNDITTCLGSNGNITYSIKHISLTGILIIYIYVVCRSFTLRLDSYLLG